MSDEVHPAFAQTHDPSGWLCVENPREPVVFVPARIGVSPIRDAYPVWCRYRSQYTNVNLPSQRARTWAEFQAKQRRKREWEATAKRYEWD